MALNTGTKKGGQIKIKILLLLLICLIWEMVARSHLYPEALFPTIEAIFINLIHNDSVFTAIFFSLFQAVMALCASTVCVLGMLVLSKRFTICHELFDLLYTLLSPIPSVAILPLVILWFGLSPNAIFFLMLHATIWPLWIQLELCQKRLTSQFYELENAYPIPLSKRLYKIYFLGSVPDLIVGLQNGFNRGWRAIISIEMIFGLVGTHMGIGWFIYEKRMLMDTVSVYGGILGIMLCGILIDQLLFNTLKKHLSVRWGIDKL
ncbi:ABC transporter permease [Fusibacter ferrireducens]|uniref:ABC transmembrane type-1 domain-containing protein n=1 Tax=Fusibacter ferrireducens TaxID=2785058 RepID=A0ABR9ZXS9_9FIRM|nr:ABC transporter permease subunit [Fusibacter ferrireducens]MBF4695264.1 hypothetical protein [Fusibacter ferrireducens]